MSEQTSDILDIRYGAVKTPVYGYHIIVDSDFWRRNTHMSKNIVLGKLRLSLNENTLPVLTSESEIPGRIEKIKKIIYEIGFSDDRSYPIFGFIVLKYDLSKLKLDIVNNSINRPNDGVRDYSILNSYQNSELICYKIQDETRCVVTHLGIPKIKLVECKYFVEYDMPEHMGMNIFGLNNKFDIEDLRLVKQIYSSRDENGNTTWFNMTNVPTKLIEETSVSIKSIVPMGLANLV